ncbi:MAG: nuclear transport factor 2 family protein [Saprospiraceae bacterium]
MDKNTDSLTTLLHDDVHYIHSNGWKESKAEVIVNILSGKLSYNDVKVHESQVRIVDNTALVTGKGTFYVSLEGKTSEFNLFYTEVYVMTESGIRLISRHACKI